MSNRPILDPVEATFRDLRGAVYAGDGRAAMAAIDRRPDLDIPFVTTVLGIAVTVTALDITDDDQIVAIWSSRSRPTEGRATRPPATGSATGRRRVG